MFFVLSFCLVVWFCLFCFYIGLLLSLFVCFLPKVFPDFPVWWTVQASLLKLAKQNFTTSQPKFVISSAKVPSGDVPFSKEREN